MSRYSFARILRIRPALSVSQVFSWAMALSAAISLVALLLVGGCVAHLLIWGNSVAGGGMAGSGAAGGSGYPPATIDALVPDLFTLVAGSSALWKLLALAALFGGCYAFATRLGERGAHEAALSVSARLRHDLYHQTLDLGGADVLGGSQGHTVQLFTVEVERVRAGLAAWWAALPGCLLQISLLLALALVVHVWLTISLVLLAVLLWLLGTSVVTTSAQRKTVLADRAAVQMSALVEGLKHARLVIGYQLADTPGTPFAEAMPRYLKQAQQLHRQENGWQLGLGLAVFAAGLLVAAVVGVNRLASPPQIDPADALLLCGTLLCAGVPAWRLLELRTSVQAADAAAESILAYLQREPRLREYPSPQAVERLATQLRLEDVSLRDAAGKALLEEVSLTVTAGQRVAIVASEPTASLSLACLFPRFYDPDAGRVLYDGLDLRKAAIPALRSQVALVPQEGLLFTASVLENIACGDFRFREDDVREAAKRIGADEPINRLPQGFATGRELARRPHPRRAAQSVAVDRGRAGRRARAGPRGSRGQCPGGGRPGPDAARLGHAAGIAPHGRSSLCLARGPPLRRGDACRAAPDERALPPPDLSPLQRIPQPRPCRP